MNGSVHKRVWKGTDGRDREAWRVRYEDPDGKRRSKTFRRKVDAERFLTEESAKLVRGEWLDPTAGLVTFGDYFGEWAQRQVWRPSTTAQVASHYRNHIEPMLGTRRVRNIRKGDVQALVKALSHELAPSTVEVVYRYVAAVMRSAVDDKLIASTPCVGISLPKAPPAKVVPLATERVLELVDCIDPRYRALVVLAAGTGLRQGEAFAVTNVDRVRFLDRKVVVDRQIVLGKGGPSFGPPKTAASVREVPLPDTVLHELARHVECYSIGASDLLFTDDRGGPLRRNRFSERHWQPAARAAGIEPGVGFHALRHYYASLLIRHGESVTTVQHRLGHASASETLNTYAHLWPDSDDRTRAAVDSVLGAGSVDHEWTMEGR